MTSDLVAVWLAWDAVFGVHEHAGPDPLPWACSFPDGVPVRHVGFDHRCPKCRIAVLAWLRRHETVTHHSGQRYGTTPATFDSVAAAFAEYDTATAAGVS